MNYLDRMCMAASVVMPKGQASQSSSKCQPSFGVVDGDNKKNSVGFGVGERKKGSQVEECMEKVIFLNCWAQS